MVTIALDCEDDLNGFHLYYKKIGNLELESKFTR